MKTRFRIAKNDTIKATAIGNGKLLSSVYDSQFTTISEVVGLLIGRIGFFSGKKVDICIYNQDKEKSKYLTVCVNK